MRAEQMLPDHADRIEADGTTIRKGTVGAFLVNARVLTDPNAAPADRARAEADTIDALPALRARPVRRAGRTRSRAACVARCAMTRVAIFDRDPRFKESP